MLLIAISNDMATLTSLAVFGGDLLIIYSSSANPVIGFVFRLAGDEEKPLGPLAVFSFLEVGVQPHQISSTTPTGHSLLATGTILRAKEFGGKVHL